ncbi:MAG: dipeptidyl-peptidase [Prolixibacteraceae bacterium]|nr:MAG: dipeptidyl-peptidase [Prolixibacteraceae bacterium]
MKSFPCLYISIGLSIVFTITTSAQQWIKEMPGYGRYKEIAPQIRGSVKPGQISVKWADDGKSFEYCYNGKRLQFDIKTKKTVELGEAEREEPPMAHYRRMYAGRPERGRQYTFANAPNGKSKATYCDGNVYISGMDGENEFAVTEEGSETKRVKYGSATWVYGEELAQTTAMWWSPDSKKLAFYSFDLTKVRDYYLQYKQTEIYDSLEVEPYTKVGAVNPVVGLMIYDLESKKTVTVDVRDGKPMTDDVLGHYIYDIQWSPDGTELLFHRTNRRQNLMEWTAANSETGKCRVIVREEWLPSYTTNSPEFQFLSDNKRFIWTSERTGFKNYLLYDLSGKQIAVLTNHPFEVAGIKKIDEKSGLLYYMARSGDNHMKLQLHRVKLDGTGEVRLTDPAYNHSVDISPDGKYFIDVAQTHNIPPFTQLLDDKGRPVSKLAGSDMTKFNELGLKKVEAFTFTSVDGKTQLHGLLHFPSNFGPEKKYPLLVSNYGGPETNEFRETFVNPNALTEYGFLVASIDGRNVGGKGKAIMDQIYGKLGYAEMDDFAEGVKSLYNRPYFDKSRVGIYGTSFGGTTSAMCLLRFPDVFHAAVANSGVMDWRNYDNIYTERYMNLLDANLEGYELTSVLKYAPNLEGKLMIYYGTSDNNVHPSNSLQLIQALQKAGKSFEVQVGPDRGHTAVSAERMMEFFIQNLVLVK